MKKLFFILFAVSFLFAQSGKISGVVFADYFYNVLRDPSISTIPNALNGGDKDFNGFQFRRLYFTYDYDINESFTSRFRLDTDPTTRATNNRYSVYIRDAYLRWKNIFPNHNLTFGIQPSPTIETFNKYWANEHLSPAFLIVRNIFGARDIGVSLNGALTQDKALSYTFMFANNSGTTPETDRYKRYYFMLQYNPAENFIANAMFDIATKPRITSSVNPKDRLQNNDLTFTFFTFLKEKNKYTAGIEGFMRATQNGVLYNNKYENRIAYGFALIGEYFLTNEASLAARVDYFEPNSHSSSKGDTRLWTIVAMNYRLNEKVLIAPNIIFENYEKLPSGKTFDPSLTFRFTLFYQF